MTEKKPVPRLLTLDPGKTSFAFCAVTGNRVRDCGMLRHTITNLDTMHANVQRDRFIACIQELVDDWQPEVFVVERFQQRPGMGGGAPAEYINVMIGILLEYCGANNLKFRGVTASTWKNHMRLAYDPPLPKLKRMSKAERKALKGPALAARVAEEKARKAAVKRPHADRLGHPVSKSSVTAPILDHEFDAIGIAQWSRETETGLELMPVFKKHGDVIWEARRADQVNAKREAAAAKKSGRAKKTKAPVKASTVRS